MKEFEPLPGLRYSEMISHKDRTDITSFLIRGHSLHIPAEGFQHPLQAHIILSLPRTINI